MGKDHFIFLILLFSMVLAIPMVHGSSQSPKEVEKWFQTLCNRKEKVTKLQFYFHDIQSGKNPTAVQIAKANITSSSPTFFGSVFAFDDALTIGPNPNSTLIGRAQGLYSSVGINHIDFLMSMNYIFTSGKYNGSTLSVLGKNSVVDMYRQFPIVGGTGVFRLARGIATAKSHWVNFTSGDAIVKHSLMIMHY